MWVYPEICKDKRPLMMEDLGHFLFGLMVFLETTALKIQKDFPHL